MSLRAAKLMWLLTLVTCATPLASRAAAADDHLRVGNSSPTAFDFVPLLVGVSQGFFKGQHLDIELIDMQGDSKLQQTFAAGSVDLGLGSGVGMALLAKGAPDIAVAAVNTAPTDIVMMVPYDSSVKTIDDLKGKSIGISTVASLTYWMAGELNRVKGWGTDGVKPIEIGGAFDARVAAMRTGQIDSMFGSAGYAYRLEEKQSARLLSSVSEYVPDYISGVLFASNQLVATKPDAIRHFITAWFQSVSYAREHKAETVKIAMTATGLDDNAQSREYDLVMSIYSKDAKFDPKALAVLQRSFVELKLVDTPPDMSKLYTEQFLPFH